MAQNAKKILRRGSKMPDVEQEPLSLVMTGVNWVGGRPKLILIGHNLINDMTLA